MNSNMLNHQKKKLNSWNKIYIDLLKKIKMIIKDKKVKKEFNRMIMKRILKLFNNKKIIFNIKIILAINKNKKIAYLTSKRVFQQNMKIQKYNNKSCNKFINKKKTKFRKIIYKRCKTQKLMQVNIQKM